MKFHDNMHVRLRSGVEIVGLTLLSDGRPTTRGLGIWRADGLRYPRAESPSDIVEVLSTPPVVLCKDVGPQVGMVIFSAMEPSVKRSVLFVVDGYVILSGEAEPWTVKWDNVGDFFIEG